MSDLIRIWVEIDHQSTHRAGGWAYLMAEGSARLGAAGGERSAGAERIAMAGLTAALSAAPPGASVLVHSASPALLAISARLAASDSEPALVDLDLWAPLTKALSGRRVRFVAEKAGPRTPGAFAAAWAEMARDKAKTKPFSAVIPQANLAKVALPVS